MLTGFENMTNGTLVKSYREVRRGPMSAKAEKIAKAMEQEFVKRNIPPNHPALRLVSVA